MNNPEFSIIIPAYNCAGCIENAVNSVLQQSFGSFELIIVNDGSTDSTADKLDSIAKLDGRVKVIHSENSGPAIARMRGISAAAGEYVMFLDSDDRFRSGALDTVSGLAEKYSPDMIIFGFSQIFTSSGKSDKHSFSSFYSENIGAVGSRFGSLYRSDILNQVWNKAIRRNMIISNNIEFPDLRFGEDRIFTARCLRNANGICVTDSILYDYIIDSEVSLISGWYDKKFFACNEIYREFISICPDESSVTDIEYMYIKSVLSCLTVLYSRKCSLSALEKRTEAEKIIKSKEISDYLSGRLPGITSELIRRILVSGSVGLNIAFAKFVVFAQDHMTSFFLKMKNH